MKIGKEKVKPLSPPMERLVSILSNQGIWGGRREEVIKQLNELENKKFETEAHLNRLQGEVTATIDGIIDNNPKQKAEDILSEAQIIVRKNHEDKFRNQKLPTGKQK